MSLAESVAAVETVTADAIRIDTHVTLPHSSPSPQVVFTLTVPPSERRDQTVRQLTLTQLEQLVRDGNQALNKVYAHFPLLGPAKSGQ